MSLTTVAGELLDAARASSSGRVASTVHGGRRQALRQTVLALAAECSLHDHDSPGEATLQVLRGRVRLTTASDSWEGAPGDYLVIPSERHGLTAMDDSVVLLTVATRSRP